MSDSRQPIQQWIIRGCSRLLLLVGAAVFLIGGKFLYEIKHVSFLVSETVGILGAVVLMLLGAGIAIRGKAPRGPEQDADERPDCILFGWADMVTSLSRRTQRTAGGIGMLVIF
jgi:hypothetical protein